MTWQTKLLHWYRKNRRDLPWRRTRDSYVVWVSEIMLQQTTVATVIPYYERFLKRFPTVQALAEADEEEVLKLWSGLGYYSRARNLHKAAQMLSGRSLPDTVEGLMTLPGIGRYTAGAIASIAFDVKAPVLDGNVVRVLSRRFAIKQDPKSASGQKIFWKRAEDSLPSEKVGDFNQALMELGATVCVPEGPSCVRCPIRVGCEAQRSGRPEDFPKGKKKTQYLDVKMSAAVVWGDRRLLMIRRPAQGLLKGMWEFPMVQGGPQDLCRVWPVQIRDSLVSVRHSVLNKRLKITPYLCLWEGSPPVGSRWVHPHDIGELATSSMNRKILNVAGRPLLSPS